MRGEFLHHIFCKRHHELGLGETTPKHPLFKRDRGKSGETVFRYIFAQPNDSNREVILSVLAFDIPTQRNQASTK